MSASGPAILLLRKLCSWCGCLIQAGHEPATHGICSKCLAEQKAKIAARREAECSCHSGSVCGPACAKGKHHCGCSKEAQQ